MAERPWPLQMRLLYYIDDTYICPLCKSSLKRRWWFPWSRTDECINPTCKSNNPGISSEEMWKRMMMRD